MMDEIAATEIKISLKEILKILRLNF